MKAKVVLCDVCKKPIDPAAEYFAITLRPNNKEGLPLKADVCPSCGESLNIDGLYLDLTNGEPF